MPVPKVAEHYRITVQKPPTPTATGNVSFMDAENKRHFADASMGTVQPGQVLDVTRTKNPATVKNGRNYDESYNIVTWKPASDAPVPKQQPQLPLSQPSNNYRQQAHPVDAKQMWINGMGQPWMAAYAQMLSISTDGTMKDMDTDTVERAMRTIMTVGDRLFGPTMTTRPKPPPVDEDMNDEIGF